MLGFICFSGGADGLLTTVTCMVQRSHFCTEGRRKCYSLNVCILEATAGLLAQFGHPWKNQTNISFFKKKNIEDFEQVCAIFII